MNLDPCDIVSVCLHPTFDTECVHLEAAAGVGVCGDEEEVVANGEGGNIGGQLRKMKTYTNVSLVS